MFVPVKKSLKDMLGNDYCQQIKRYMTTVHKANETEVNGLIEEEIDFFPVGLERELDYELELVGKNILPRFSSDTAGAGTDSIRKASNLNMSPIGGKGFYRIGEDGKVYFIGKSEHYHVPLGHNFPGFKLLRNAKDLGIVNATHNNTRGYITRLLEEKLICIANGISMEDKHLLNLVLDSNTPHVINRVINLETGSIAVEAGLKMMLNRFYKLEENLSNPKYSGRTPVLFVMGDEFGGLCANYHGTTTILQTTRGLWPEFSKMLSENGILEIVPIRINDIQDFRSKMDEFDCGDRKVAGFMHEIVLMNYGAITLSKSFLKEAYNICHQHDVPVLVDEIQSCIWYKELFLYRDYDITPDFVIIGKGFSGGEYPASKILTTKEMDNLNQFGALVTNGQEEIASLAYLITMEFALQNAEVTVQIGEKYMEGLCNIANKYPKYISKIVGIGHLAAIHFYEIEHAITFADKVNYDCIDVSAHGYKSVCLPAVLTKLPLITTYSAIDFLLRKMDAVLEQFL